MAQVHKARKGGKKYGFQRNQKKTLGWIIGIVAVIAAIVIGIVVYNNSTTGTIKVAAPADASLNNIADNWTVLASHTDKFVNSYASSEDGTNGNGGTMLVYLGSEAADAVYIYIKPAQFLEAVTNDGMYVRPNIFSTDLGKLFSGEISLTDTTVALQAGNENCLIYLEDYNAETLDDSALNKVIAELEAIIAAGPVVTEEPAEAPAETPAEATETPAESTETAPAAE